MGQPLGERVRLDREDLLAACGAVRVIIGDERMGVDLARELGHLDAEREGRAHVSSELGSGKRLEGSHAAALRGDGVDVDLGYGDPVAERFGLGEQAAAFEHEVAPREDEVGGRLALPGVREHIGADEAVALRGEEHLLLGVPAHDGAGCGEARDEGRAGGGILRVGKAAAKARAALHIYRVPRGDIGAHVVRRQSHAKLVVFDLSDTSDIHNLNLPCAINACVRFYFERTHRLMQY